MTTAPYGNASNAAGIARSRVTASLFCLRMLIALMSTASCVDRPEFKTCGVSVYLHGKADKEPVMSGVASGAECASAYVGWSCSDSVNMHVTTDQVKSPSGRSVSGYALCPERHIVARYSNSPGEFASLVCHELAHIALCDAGMDDPAHALPVWEEIDKPYIK